MNIVPQTTQAASASIGTSTHTNTVVTGRQDFLSILLRLIGAEMYKVRRRAMSKILLITGICIIVLAFLVIAINMISDLNTPVQEYSALVPCSQVPPAERTPSSGQTCINHPPTQHKVTQIVKTIKSQLLRCNLLSYFPK